MRIPPRPRWVSRLRVTSMVPPVVEPPLPAVSQEIAVWQPTPCTPPQPIDFQEDAWVNSHHMHRVSGKLHPLLDAHNERHTDPDATTPRMAAVRRTQAPAHVAQEQEVQEQDTLYTQAVRVPAQATGQHTQAEQERTPSQALTRRSLPIDWLLHQAIERFYVQYARLPHGILLNPVRNLEHGATTHQWHTYTYQQRLDGRTTPLAVPIPLASAMAGELGMDEIRLF